MRHIKNFKEWMATEIVKTYLLENGKFEISVPSDRQFDLIAIDKYNFRNVIGIEIKASKYSRNELLKAYLTTRENLSKAELPVIIFYINSVDRTGYIELLNKKVTDELLPLNTDNLGKLLNQARSPAFT